MARPPPTPSAASKDQCGPWDDAAPLLKLPPNVCFLPSTNRTSSKPNTEPMARAPKPITATLITEKEYLEEVEEKEEEEEEDVVEVVEDMAALKSFNSPLSLCTAISHETPAKPSLQKHAPSLHNPRLLQS
jgi:hypothetical protein